MVVVAAIYFLDVDNTFVNTRIVGKAASSELCMERAEQKQDNQ